MQVAHDLAQAQIGDASCGTRNPGSLERTIGSLGLSVEAAARTEFGSQALDTPICGSGSRLGQPKPSRGIVDQ